MIAKSVTLSPTAAAPAALPGEGPTASAGFKTSHTLPVVPRPTQARLALGAAHSCFLDARGTGWCWGGNLFGEVGNSKHGWTGDLDDVHERTSGVAMPSRLPLQNLREVAAWRGRSFAVDGRGRIYAWGVDVGVEVDGHRFVDRPTLQPTSVLAMHVAPAGPSVLGANTKIYWGALSSTGIGREVAVPYVLAPVRGLEGEFMDVASSDASSCAVRKDRTVWCWGKNDFGQLGYPKSPPNSTPRQVAELRVSSISAGHYHFCTLSAEHTSEAPAVYCWGQANHHQLGNPERVMTGISSPQLVQLPMPAIQVEASAGTTIVVIEDGSVHAWGENFHGLLGVADRSMQRPKPAAISGLERIVQIGVGSTHACALREDETVWCWGRGDDYQLGNGKNVDSHVPVQVVFPRIP